MKKQNKKKFKFPTSYTILFFALILIMLLSWVLHFTGVKTVFNRTDDNPAGEEGIVKGVGIFDVFTSIFLGFESRAEIIVFLLMIGSFMFIVMKSKSLDAFTQRIASKMGNRSIWAIPVIMLFLSFAGSAYGMAEESLGFHMIVIPLMLAAGFDKVTAIMVVLLGVGVGPLAATFDPFLILTAIDAAKKQDPNIMVTITDGLIWRAISWVVLTSLTIGFVMVYAIKVKKNPSKSVTFATYEEDKNYFLKEQVEVIPLTKKRKAIISLFFIAFIIMILYLVSWDKLFGFDAEPINEWMYKYLFFWSGFSPLLSGGMFEVAAIFLIFSIIVGAINWAGEEKFLSDLLEGSRDLLGIVFIVSLAGAITVLFGKSGIQDALSQGLDSAKSMNPFGFILLSYFVFLPISFIIPSTSGFSGAIFPTWGQLAHQIPIGTTTMLPGSITAFAFANGFLNVISPASGIVVGGLQIAKMDYGQYIKATWLYFLLVFLTSIILLVAGTALNYTGSNIF